MGLGVILGGRIGYVLFYQPQLYLQNPLELFMLWHGGMSFHGGVIGTTIAMPAAVSATRCGNCASSSRLSRAARGNAVVGKSA